MTRARMEELKRNKLGLHPVSSELLDFVDELLPVLEDCASLDSEISWQGCMRARAKIEALQESK